MRKDMISRYAEIVIRGRVWIVIATIVLTVFFGSRIGKLVVDMNPNMWAPQQHPYFKTTQALEETFGGRNVVIIGIVPKKGDIFQPDILQKIKRIQEGLERIPEVIRTNTLSLAARKIKDIRGTKDGMEVRQMMETVPETDKDSARLRAAVFSNPMYVNTLVSQDGRAASVIGDFKINKDHPSYSLLCNAVRDVVDKERDAHVEIFIGGLPVFLNWVELYMMKMPVYFGAALVIIILIQYWSFKSLQGMLLPIVTALLSVVWGLGFMGLSGVHMDPMNTNTPILIMAVAAGHAIQILKRYYEEFSRLKKSGGPTLTDKAANQAAVIESLVRVGPVMVTAGLIASITFFSLTMAEISVVRHFGFFAGSGVLATLILEMTFIPAVRSLLPAPQSRETEREQKIGLLDRLLHSLAESLVTGKAPLILALVLGIIVFATAGAFWLFTDNSFKRYHTAHSQVRIEDAVLNERFGGTNPILFLVEGRDQDTLKDPKVLKAMSALQNFLISQPHVGKTQSLVDLVERMHQAMHGDDPVYHRVPESRDLIAQYLLLYSMSGDPQDLDSFVDTDYRKAVIWAYLKDDSTAYADALYNKAREVIDKNFPPEVSVRMGGALANTIAINEVLTKSKLKNMVQMTLIVFLLSSIAFRSFVGGLFVITPLITIIMTNFGLMGWLGVPLDMGTATTASMAIGIGADYEIYLLFRFREELAKTGDILRATLNSLLTSGKAILLVAFSIMGGYAVLLTSGFGFYTRLSTMVIFTMLFSALSAILFLRSMMMIVKPRFIFGEYREQPFTLPQPN